MDIDIKYLLASLRLRVNLKMFELSLKNRVLDKM